MVFHRNDFVDVDLNCVMSRCYKPVHGGYAENAPFEFEKPGFRTAFAYDGDDAMAGAAARHGGCASGGSSSSTSSGGEEGEGSSGRDEELSVSSHRGGDVDMLGGQPESQSGSVFFVNGKRVKPFAGGAAGFPRTAGPLPEQHKRRGGGGDGEGSSQHACLLDADAPHPKRLRTQPPPPALWAGAAPRAGGGDGAGRGGRSSGKADVLDFFANQAC